MISIDFKDLKSLENMRGVFYVLAICSVTSPALLALYVTDVELLLSSTVVAVLIAVAAGLLCTSLFTCSVFIDGLASGFLSAQGRMRAGTSALALGPLLSLLLQCCVLGYCAYFDANFRSYVFAATAFPFAIGVQGVFRFGFALRKAERETKKSASELKKIGDDRHRIATELEGMEAQLERLQAGELTEEEKKQLLARFRAAKAKAEKYSRSVDAIEENLGALRQRFGGEAKKTKSEGD